MAEGKEETITCLGNLNSTVKRTTISKKHRMKLFQVQCHHKPFSNLDLRVAGNNRYTHNQVQGFTYFYPKRKVLEYGVTTLPLNILSDS